MNPEDISFEEFFAERTRQKGFSLKKLADATGITPRNLADIASGNFAAMPSAPYVRGYLIRLGEVLDFDGESWWQKIKVERSVKNSGATDALPKNRFLKKYPTRYIVGAIIITLIIIYAIVQFPTIAGRPMLVVTNPAQSPFTTDMNQFTMQGTVQNASALSIDGDNVAITPEGLWQKEILLSNGLNQITVSAKKFLGGTTAVTEQILYQGSTPIVNAATSSPSSTIAP